MHDTPQHIEADALGTPETLIAATTAVNDDLHVAMNLLFEQANLDILLQCYLDSKKGGITQESVLRQIKLNTHTESDWQKVATVLLGKMLSDGVPSPSEADVYATAVTFMISENDDLWTLTCKIQLVKSVVFTPSLRDTILSARDRLEELIEKAYLDNQDKPMTSEMIQTLKNIFTGSKRFAMREYL